MKIKFNCLKIFEFIYYIVGFALVDMIMNLIQGEPINILMSFAFSAFFTLIFFVLMLFWVLITRGIKK